MFNFRNKKKNSEKEENKEVEESIKGDFVFLKEDEIKQKVNDGFFYTRFTFEILGSPKEHIEKAMQLYLDKIYKDGFCDFTNTYISEAEEKDKLFLVIAELECIIDKSKLGDFCIAYMPAYFEIIEPANIKVESSNLTSLFNGLLSKLHQIEMGNKNLISEVKLLDDKLRSLNKNSNIILKNFIQYILYKETKTKEELSQITKINAEVIGKIMDDYVSKGDFVLKKKKYGLPPKSR